MEYRGYEIKVSELPNLYVERLNGTVYHVSADQMFYSAYSGFGETYALSGPEALALQKLMIDRAIARGQ